MDGQIGGWADGGWMGGQVDRWEWVNGWSEGDQVDGLNK